MNENDFRNFILYLGKGLGLVHRSTGLVENLKRVQFLYTYNDLNESSAPVHWTQTASLYLSKNFREF
jgi:hypothetical protein